MMETARVAERRNIGGVEILVGDRDIALAAILSAIRDKKPEIWAFCNAHTVNCARSDPAFRVALPTIRFLNDGVGINIASRMLYGVGFPENLNGTDLTPQLLARLPAEQSVFLLGSAPQIAEVAARTLQRQFPLLQIAGAHHGFFSLADETAIADQIRASNAALVLVAMGNPLQELWAARNAERIGIPLICVGAFLDFSAGVVRRSPAILQRAKLEWAFRLAQEPRRLARRYLIGNATFLAAVIRQRLRPTVHLSVAATARSHDQCRDQTSMNILIIGGSSHHPGGVEAFCDRAEEALAKHDPLSRVERLATETAYLTPARMPVVVRQLRTLLCRRKTRPDVVWVQYVNLPDLLYVAAARLLGMRIVVTPHLGTNWRSQQNPVLRRMSAGFMALADRIALLSPTQAQEIALPARTERVLLRSFLPSSILDAPPPSPPPPATPLRLLHAARLSREKGSLQVIEMAARLKAAGTAFVLHIAGGADPVFFQQLRDAIARHGLCEQVKLIGRVEGGAMLSLLCDADVLVHLSTIDSYPLILLEALACGALPIAIGLAGARDIIANYDGVIVDEKDASRAAADWLIAADVVALRQRAQAQAPRIRGNYHWDIVVHQLTAALFMTPQIERNRANAA